MKVFKGDLHIHTCLSPCAELEMSPVVIVETSLKKGLDFIAVCDHNSAENVGAVLKAGSKRGLIVFPGMEINSIEEVHILAIFRSEKQAVKMQDIIYKNLDGVNRPEIFGEQIIANEFDEVHGFNEKLLIGATRLKLKDIVRETHFLGGLSIASHVDRPSYSVMSQLGFIPPDLEFDAVEISFRSNIESFLKTTKNAGAFPVITSSDAHRFDDIGKVQTSFFIETPCLDEIRMAFEDESGRRIIN